jgi:hypothetical protein
MTNNHGQPENKHSRREERIGWHPAFFEAIQLELEPYKDILRFVAEYQLTTEPLRIDVLIIKKAVDVIIEKNIAAIFRRENIVEYKSPGDYISVEDFYKIYGYACLYANLNKVAITDLTITFAGSRYPRGLMAHLRKERNYDIEEQWPGIYIVRGDIVPIQIIESRKLSGEENLWLKGLSNRLEVGEIRRLAGEIRRQGKGAGVRAYMEAIFSGNLEKMEEAFRMSDTVMTMEQLLEDAGLTAKWEARGKAMGEEKKALEIAKNLLGNGFSVEQTAKLAGLEIGKVEALVG